MSNLVRPLAREQWISACHFHDLSESEVLREVSRRVSDLRARVRAEGGSKKAHPLVLLDLDSTLYEVGPRTLQILKEWADTEESREFAEVCDALARAELAHVGYSVRDTWSALGLSVDSLKMQAAMESAKRFWSDRFFTSEYLKYDRAYPGAAAFTRSLHEMGAEVVYLTGRDEPNMGDGTRDNLLRDGFPWEVPSTHLLLKKAAHLPDLDHKKEAAEYIRTHGNLVASFENEPPNLIALYELFPEAMHVFVDTVCSDHPAMPSQGLYRIRSFE